MNQNAIVLPFEKAEVIFKYLATKPFAEVEGLVEHLRGAEKLSKVLDASKAEWTREQAEKDQARRESFAKQWKEALKNSPPKLVPSESGEAYQELEVDPEVAEVTVD